MTFNYLGNFKQVSIDADSRFSLSSIQGQTNRYVNLMSDSAKIGVFGVFFHPYALAALFSVPASDLTNKTVDLDEFLGVQGVELEERIMHTSSEMERLKIVSLFLENRVDSIDSRNSQLIGAVRYLENQTAPVNLKEFAEDNFLSQRQFERKFKELVGFTPQLFNRISRFERGVNTCLNANFSLTEAALESGYFDQSHFIREFREFSGLSPGKYLSDREYLSTFV